MGDRTGIEWTDATWNPVVGCAHVSPGCDHCYAAREASGRLKGVPVYAGLAEGGKFTGEVRCLPERLDQPMRWRKPRRVFVNSMSDLFHKDVNPQFIGSVWATMALAEQHTFQVLTKRPQRASAVLRSWGDRNIGAAYGGPIWRDHLLRWNEAKVWPLSNVWLGTSIESDRYVWRADHLRQTPAAVRWLSLEPLLSDLPSLDLTGIDWVVVGGESGPGARPMHPGWVRDIRDRCVAAGVPFLFKQWGEWAPAGVWGGEYRQSDNILRSDGYSWPLDQPHGAEDGTGVVVRRLGKKAAGRTLEGRTWDQYPDDAGAET